MKKTVSLVMVYICLAIGCAILGVIMTFLVLFACQYFNINIFFAHAFYWFMTSSSMYNIHIKIHLFFMVAFHTASILIYTPKSCHPFSITLDTFPFHRNITMFVRRTKTFDILFYCNLFNFFKGVRTYISVTLRASITIFSMYITKRSFPISKDED